MTYSCLLYTSFEKNKAYYGNNHWIIKRNISVLAESLKRAFIIRKDDFVSRSDAGQLVPERLWKIGRTDDDKLFNRKKRSEDSEFVIDVLIDSSGSQAGRQAQVCLLYTSKRFYEIDYKRLQYFYKLQNI